MHTCVGNTPSPREASRLLHPPYPMLGMACLQHDFEPNETVVDYGGTLVSTETFNGPGYPLSEYGVQINANWVRDGRSTQSGLGRWVMDCLPVNRPHDCPRNNSRIILDQRRRRASIRATRHIDAGDEIFASYGENYWRER